MKTKKEIREEIITKNIRRKQRDQIVPIMLLLNMVIVSIWKFDRLFIHFDFYIFAKIYLIAIGAGYCFGLIISFCYSFIKVDLEKKKYSINNKMEKYSNQIKILRDNYQRGKDILSHYQIQKRKESKIQRLRDRINKLEVEYLMLENE